MQLNPGLDVSVVLPTFNESENLRSLIPRICRTLDRTRLTFEVIVVDDDSPDGTGQVAESLAAMHPVRLLLRKSQRGLSSAVLAGFTASTAKVCVVMDADGSHPVESLPDMIVPLLEDRADITVGSRHVAGGSIEKWTWRRRFVSRTASWLASGVTKLRDPTSGFMAIRRELLEGLQLNPIGWKIVLEIVVKSHRSRLLEVPISFRDRELGASKFSFKEQWNYIRHLSRLYRYRFPGLAEFARFCLVGLSGVGVDMAVVIGAKEFLSLDTRLCAVLGFLVAVTTNFFLNRNWSFPRGTECPVWKSYSVFFFVCCLGLAARLGVIHALIELAYLDGGNEYLLTNLLGILAATIVNFTGSKTLAFHPARLATRPTTTGAVVIGIEKKCSS